MNTLILIIFIAAFLPYLTKIPVAIAMSRQDGYDNCHPREQQRKLVGFGARALAAHQNSFEALIIFGVAMSVAIATGSTHENIVVLGFVHIITRVLYSVMYYLNLNVVRSLIWFVATGCSFAIIWLSMS